MHILCVSATSCVKVAAVFMERWCNGIKQATLYSGDTCVEASLFFVFCAIRKPVYPSLFFNRTAIFLLSLNCRSRDQRSHCLFISVSLSLCIFCFVYDGLSSLDLTQARDSILAGARGPKSQMLSFKSGINRNTCRAVVYITKGTAGPSFVCSVFFSVVVADFEVDYAKIYTHLALLVLAPLHCTSLTDSLLDRKHRERGLTACSVLYIPKTRG